MHPSARKVSILDTQVKCPRELMQSLQTPPSGWMRFVRAALGMSLRQLSDRLNISSPGVHKLEKMDSEEKLTVAKLRTIARSMECEFVYGFVPMSHDSFELLLKERADMTGADLDRVFSSSNLWRPLDGDPRRTPTRGRNNKL
jgi:predicted DNA-binding mobile mystery protein A